MTKARILIVEDEMLIARDIRTRLKSLGYEVVGSAMTGREGAAKAKELLPDLVLMDIVLKGKMSGIEAAEHIQGGLDIPVVYLTSHSDEETLTHVKPTRPYGYVLKPFKEKELVIAVELGLYRHLMDKRLRESEEKYRFVVESANEAILIVQNGKIKFLNGAALSKTGYSAEDLKTIPLEELIHPEDRAAFPGVGKKRAGIPFRFLRKSGAELWMQSDSIPITWEEEPATLHFVRDIHSQRRMEEQRLQAMRMEAVAMMLVGLAHELRNPLTVISSSTQICLSESGLSSAILERLRMIYESSGRANRLIRGSLEFARSRHLELQSVGVNEIVTRAWNAAQLDPLASRVSWDVRLGEDLPEIKGDPAKLEQVFLNLLLNALQAVAFGGRIEAQTRWLPSLKRVEIDIFDDGPSIAPELHSRIFEPFFTTKKGSGSGLGLSICQAVVQQHNGVITVECPNDQGVKFSVQLPLRPDDEG